MREAVLRVAEVSASRREERFAASPEQASAMWRTARPCSPVLPFRFVPREVELLIELAALLWTEYATEWATGLVRAEFCVHLAG